MINKDLIGRKRALSLEDKDVTPPTKKFHGKENENPLAHANKGLRLVSPAIVRGQFICLFDSSNAICPDCGQHIKSWRSHQALCGRKTVKCSYRSLTSGGDIPVTLHRVNGMFTCRRCDKVLKKDANMRVRFYGH